MRSFIALAALMTALLAVATASSATPTTEPTSMPSSTLEPSLTPMPSSTLEPTTTLEPSLAPTMSNAPTPSPTRGDVVAVFVQFDVTVPMLTEGALTAEHIREAVAAVLPAAISPQEVQKVYLPSLPTLLPTPVPTITSVPTVEPTPVPTQPTAPPTASPTGLPSTAPIPSPTAQPSPQPTQAPSYSYDSYEIKFKGTGRCEEAKSMQTDIEGVMDDALDCWIGCSKRFDDEGLDLAAVEFYPGDGNAPCRCHEVCRCLVEIDEYEDPAVLMLPNRESLPDDCDAKRRSQRQRRRLFVEPSTLQPTLEPTFSLAPTAVPMLEPSTVPSALPSLSWRPSHVPSLSPTHAPSSDLPHYLNGMNLSATDVTVTVTLEIRVSLAVANFHTYGDLRDMVEGRLVAAEEDGSFEEALVAACACTAAAGFFDFRQNATSSDVRNSFTFKNEPGETPRDYPTLFPTLLPSATPMPTQCSDSMGGSLCWNLKMHYAPLDLWFPEEPRSGGTKRSDDCWRWGTCVPDSKQMCDLYFCRDPERCQWATLCEESCGYCAEGPTSFPTAVPTVEPTIPPTPAPSQTPTPAPSSTPTPVPSPVPTAAPIPPPSAQPSPYPTPGCREEDDRSMFRIEMESPGPTGWPDDLRVQVTTEQDPSFSLILEGPDSLASKVHYLCFENSRDYAFAWVFLDDLESANSQSAAAFRRRESDGFPDLFSAGIDWELKSVGKNGTVNNDEVRKPNQDASQPSSVGIPVDGGFGPMPSPLPTLSLQPSSHPTRYPSMRPTSKPSTKPSNSPSPMPSPIPTDEPSPVPTVSPTERCIEGQYLNRTTMACLTCPIGRFNRNQSETANTLWNHSLEGGWESGTGFKTFCDLCPAGHYQNEKGKAHCKKCPEGELAKPDRTRCGLCDPGHYGDVATSTCIPCPKGTYAPVAMIGSCLNCKAGNKADDFEFEKDNTGARKCMYCEPGKYSEGNAIDCKICTSGTYSLTGADACVDCEVGKFNDKSEQTSCGNCVSGTFQQKTRQTRCIECDPGKSQNAGGQGSCNNCTAGKYSDVPGLSTCRSCEAGTYEPYEGSTLCTECEAGRVQPFGSQSDCVECPIGSYRAFTRGTFCESCAEGYWSRSGQTVVCSICQEGYALSGKQRDDVTNEVLDVLDEEVITDGVAHPECKSCNGLEGTCVGGEFAPIPYEGYWYDRSGGRQDHFYFYKCPQNTCASIGTIPDALLVGEVVPTIAPSISMQPTMSPQPTPQPSPVPSPFPTLSPSPVPIPLPSALPTIIPTPIPSPVPTSLPTLPPSFTVQPTLSLQPTLPPSPSPTLPPTSLPTSTPTVSSNPTQLPTYTPTSVPSITIEPSPLPTPSPSAEPAWVPSPKPSPSPTHTPTLVPTEAPTQVPSGTFLPTNTFNPTSLPTNTKAPTHNPTNAPTQHPTMSFQPTVLPTFSLPPTSLPTATPTHDPTESPSADPTEQPPAGQRRRRRQLMGTNDGDGGGGGGGDDDDNDNNAIVATTRMLHSLQKRDEDTGVGELWFQARRRLEDTEDASSTQDMLSSNSTLFGNLTDEFVCFSTSENLAMCADQVCSERATGPMCGACSEGSYMSSASRLCEVCSIESYLSSMMVLMVLAVAGVGVYMLVTAGGMPVPVYLQERFELPQRVQLPFVDALMKVDNGALKVMWVTSQIVVSVGWSLDTEFPEPFNSWLVAPSFMQLNFLSMDCFMEGADFHTTVYVQSAFPVVLVILVWASYFITVVVDCEATKEQKNESFAHHMQVFLLITYLTLPAVSTTQFNALNCVQFDHNEQAYLKMDTRIDCNGEQHKQFIIYDLLMISFYQLIPIAWIYVLCQHRNSINPAKLEHLSMEATLLLRDKDDSLDALRFLFNDYKPEAYFYEVIDMYRRIIFIGVIPLMGEDLTIRAYVGCALGLFFAVYFRETLPYRVMTSNFLGFMAQYQILLTFLAGLLINSDAVQTLGLSDLWIGVVLMATNTFVLVAALYIGWYKYKQAMAKKALEEKPIKIEWAAHFSAAKFRTTFQSVVSTSVPLSHVLVYHYTSMAAARKMARDGIPALHGQGGVILSLRGPCDLLPGDHCLRHMSSVAPCREAVLCASIPRKLLFRPGFYDDEDFVGKKDKSLVMLPANVLASMSAMETMTDYEEREHKRKIAVAELARKYSDEDKRRRQDEKAAKGKKAEAELELPEESGSPTEYNGAGNDALVAGAKLPAGERAERDIPPLRREHTPFVPKALILRAYQLLDDEVLVERELQPREYFDSQARDEEEEEKHAAAAAAGGGGNGGGGNDAKNSSSSSSSNSRREAAKERENILFPPRPDHSQHHVRAKPPVTVPEACDWYVERMRLVREECAARGYVPLYHFTVPFVAPMILDGGFRMSSQGQGDGGVYFSTLGPASYDLGAPDYEDNIIIDCFGQERLEEYRGKHKLDVCLVYGCDPKVLVQAPGGRDNAKMVPKVYFESFGAPNEITGDYFLRPDRVMAAFHLDPAHPPAGLEDAIEGMQGEKRRDQQVKESLGGLEKEADENGKRCGDYQHKLLFEQQATAASSKHKTWLHRQIESIEPATTKATNKSSSGGKKKGEGQDNSFNAKVAALRRDPNRYTPASSEEDDSASEDEEEDPRDRLRRIEQAFFEKHGRKPSKNEAMEERAKMAKRLRFEARQQDIKTLATVKKKTKDLTKEQAWKLQQKAIMDHNEEIEAKRLQALRQKASARERQRKIELAEEWKRKVLTPQGSRGSDAEDSSSEGESESIPDDQMTARTDSFADQLSDMNSPIGMVRVKQRPTQEEHRAEKVKVMRDGEVVEVNKMYHPISPMATSLRRPSFATMGERGDDDIANHMARHASLGSDSSRSSIPVPATPERRLPHPRRKAGTGGRQQQQQQQQQQQKNGRARKPAPLRRNLVDDLLQPPAAAKRGGGGGGGGGGGAGREKEIKTSNRPTATNRKGGAEGGLEGRVGLGQRIRAEAKKGAEVSKRAINKLNFQAPGERRAKSTAPSEKKVKQQQQSQQQQQQQQQQHRQQEQHPAASATTTADSKSAEERRVRTPFIGKSAFAVATSAVEREARQQREADARADLEAVQMERELERRREEEQAAQQEEAWREAERRSGIHAAMERRRTAAAAQQEDEARASRDAAELARERGFRASIEHGEMNIGKRVEIFGLTGPAAVINAMRGKVVSSKAKLVTIQLDSGRKFTARTSNCKEAPPKEEEEGQGGP